MVSPKRLCRSPRISWYAPVRKMPRMYGSPSDEGVQLERAACALPPADEAVDLAVRVAGHVLQRAAPRRLLVQPVDRHDREELVDRPGVGQRLEEREVAEVAVGEDHVELGEDVLVLLRVLGRELGDAVHDGEVEALHGGAVAEAEHAAVEERAAPAPSRRPRRGRPRAGCARSMSRVGSPRARARARARPRRSGLAVAADLRLQVDHVDQQQRVVRGQRAARLRDDVRHRHLVLAARLRRASR